MPEAVSVLKKGLLLSLMHWRRQCDLARPKAATGDGDGARRILDWTSKWADDHPPLVMLNTDLLVDAGHADDARQRLEHLIRRYPDKRQYVQRHKKLCKTPNRPAATGK